MTYNSFYLGVSMSAADEVMNNWQALVTRIQGAQTEKAVTEMMIATQLYATPLTPKATGNLINDSQFRDIKQGVNGMTGIVGYSAEYAAAVHEAKGTLKGEKIKRPIKKIEGGIDLGNFWDGGNGPDSGEPKFLEKGRDAMIKYDYEQIVKEAYKL
jgi:hypothetical protein